MIPLSVHWVPRRETLGETMDFFKFSLSASWGARLETLRNSFLVFAECSMGRHQANRMNAFVKFSPGVSQGDARDA